MTPRVLLVATAALLVLVAAVPSGQAKLVGDCAMAVQGQDLAAGEVRIPAPADGNLTYVLASTVPIVRWSVTLHYGPFDRVVFDEEFPDGVTAQEGAFDVSAYTKYGTGLYSVTGEATLEDGSSCSGTMELKVAGSPFTSALGLAAITVLGAGAIGILLTVLQIIVDAKDVVEAAKDFIEQAKGGTAAIAGLAAAGATAGNGGGPEERGKDRTPPDGPGQPPAPPSP